MNVIKDCCDKMTPNDVLVVYSEISLPLFYYQRSFCLPYMVTNAETFKRTVHRGWEILEYSFLNSVFTSPKLCGSINFLSSELMDLWRRRIGKSVRGDKKGNKKLSRHKKVVMNIWTHRDCGSMHRSYIF